VYARGFFDKSIELESENADAFNNLGVLEIQRGNIESARNNFIRALSVSPANREAKKNLNMLPNPPDVAGFAHSCLIDTAGKGVV
jgi:Flp pilus assembly protein TadD